MHSLDPALSRNDFLSDLYLEDADRSFRPASLGASVGMDAPDGLYQGEIILGPQHLPEFTNRQRHETRYRTESTQHLMAESF